MLEPGRPVGVVLALAIALLLSLAYLSRTEGLTPDSYQYLRGGTSLWTGGGYTALEGEAQTVFPPGYPALLGLVDFLTHDPVVAARWVSVGASALSVLLMYLLGRALFSSLVGAVAAGLLAVLPLRMQTSVMALSESTFLALVLLGLLVWARSETRPWVGLLAGVALGAAYLTRPEGLLVFAVCALGGLTTFVGRQGHRRSAVLRVTTVVVGFVVVALPFWVHLRQHTGHFSLTGKAERNLSIASARAADVPYQRLRILNEEATEIVYPPTASTPTAIVSRLARNLRRLGGMLTDMTSLFLLACLGLALAALLRYPASRRTAIHGVILIAVALLVTPSVFFLEFRMLLAPLALLLLLAAGALWGGDDGRAEGKSSQTKVAAWLLALAVLQLSVGSALLIADPIGEPTADITPLVASVRREPDATGAVMGNSREPRALALATGRDFLDLPWEPLPRVLDFARHRSASFLLVRADDHPDLARLALRAVTTQELRPLARVEAGSGKERRALQLYLIAPPHPRESGR